MKQKNQNSSIFTKKIAFTLAEVIITLGIIGIVAEITIPTLISNYRKQEYLNSFKKAYTNTTQAFMSIAQEEGCPGNLECTNLFDESTSDTQTVDQNILNALSKKLKVIKSCGYSAGTATDECSPNVKYLVGSGTSSRSGIRFILADGIALNIEDLAGNCALFTDKFLCAVISFDTNAAKLPNTMGRDYYQLYLQKNGTLMPHGYGGTWNVNSGTPQDVCRTDVATSYGKACAGRIIEENWQMNY